MFSFTFSLIKKIILFKGQREIMDKANKGNKIKSILQNCIEKCTVCITICKSIYNKESLYTFKDSVYANNECIDVCQSCIIECQNQIKDTNNQHISSLLEECIDKLNESIHCCKMTIEESKLQNADLEVFQTCAAACTRTIESCIKATLIDYNIRQ